MEGGEGGRQPAGESSGSLPSVRLPLASQSGIADTQASQAATQVASLAEGNPPGDQGDGDEDLFGSDVESHLGGSSVGRGSDRGALSPLLSPNAGTPARGTPAAGTPPAGTPAAGTPAAGMPASSAPPVVPPVAPGVVGPGTPIASAPDSAPFAGSGVAVPLASSFQAAAGPQSGDAPPRAQEPAGEAADDFDEKDLFGDEDEPDEKELFGSDDDDDVDEKELFGSDEEAVEAPAGAEATGKPAPSEPSELDEREIFGDVSDDEPEKAEDVILRRRPAPSDDRELKTLRLPNVLSIDKMPFSKDRLPQALLEGYKEYKTTRDTQAVKLLNAENCIRWRFKKGPDGQILTDEDGRPQYESNARFVEWEDGSKTLHVGKETFFISEIDDHVVLFEENSQDVQVCHGIIRKRLVATPTSLNSATHESLKKSQFKKVEPVRRSLLLSQEEHAENKQLYELEMEQKKRQQARPERAAQQGASDMTAAFLEEDQPDASAGPSVLDVKRQYRSGGDAKRRRT